MKNYEFRTITEEDYEYIYQLKKNEQEKQEALAALESEMQEKRLRIAEAGSVAQAAVEITQLLSAAQKTADLYLQEIAARKEETEKECARLLEEAKKQAEAILTEARTKRRGKHGRKK